MILFFEKGKRKLNDLGMPDILEVDRIRTAYPTEKPVKLFEKLILQSSTSGDTVCDPFCGAGPCAEASIRQKRIFTGNDKSRIAVKLTKDRIIAFKGTV